MAKPILSAACCCGEPCPPPVVECDFIGGTFNYTVENAVTAVVEAFNRGESRPFFEPVETYPVTLVDGEASGSIEPPSGTDLTYCIVVANECAAVTCCAECLPCGCSLEMIQGDPSVGEYEVIIRATLFACPYDFISINFDGDVYEYPGGDAPTTFDKVYSIGCVPSQVCFTATTDCGSNAHCCYTPPCCWTVDTVAVELSGLEEPFSQTCRFERADGVGFQHTITISGLGALNGTTLRLLTSSGLRADPEFSAAEDTPCRCWQRGLIRTGVWATMTAVNTYDFLPATAFDCPRTLVGGYGFDSVEVSGEVLLTCVDGHVYITIDIDSSYEESERPYGPWPACVPDAGGCRPGFVPHPTLTDRCIREDFYVGGDFAPIGSVPTSVGAYACNDSHLDCDDPGMCERVGQIFAIIQTTIGNTNTFGPVVPLGICNTADSFLVLNPGSTLTCNGVLQNPAFESCIIGFYNSRITYITCIPSGGG